MHDLSLMAATEWARAHAARSFDPIKFGGEVALVYRACQMAAKHAGDSKAMFAALAALSIPPEMLQLIEQLASLDLSHSAQQPQKDSAGAL